MALVGNILWFVFIGLWSGLGWWLLGIVCYITVVGIPFGVACFRISRFAFFPFGKDLVPAEMVGEKAVAGSLLGNILWVIIFGLWISLGYAFSGIALCCTIIGIPWGIACFRLAGASFAPLGKRVVSMDVAKVARQRFAQNQLDKMTAK